MIKKLAAIRSWAFRNFLFRIVPEDFRLALADSRNGRIIEMMIDDPYHAVRRHCAENPFASDAVLYQAANDPHWEVRKAACWNSGTRHRRVNDEIRVKLESDPYVQVRSAAKMSHGKYTFPV